MRRTVATTIAVLVCAGAASAAPSERRFTGWAPMSLTFTGDNIAYARSTATTIVPGGYTIYRTDTYRLPLSGVRLVGKQVDGMVLRTSAGRTAAGTMSGDDTGRYLVTATGRNFPPQLVFCCTAEERDLPVEAEGRADAPVTLAATLHGPLVRYVAADPGGTFRLVSFHVAEGPGEPFTLRESRALGANVARGLVAMAPGLLAWVESGSPGSVHLATTPAGSFDAVPGPVIPLNGTVVRLHVTPRTFVVLTRVAGGYTLVRHDAPDWTPTVVWRGTRPPGPTAVGDRTVALVAGGVLQQHVPGSARRGIYRVRGTAAAVASDGRRIAILERRRDRVGRRVVKRSAIVVVNVRRPPAAYTAERTR